MTVLDTTGAHGATPAPGGDDLLDVPAPDERGLRALRASLVDETLRLRRWQRLVQARLDLATDRLSPAEALLGPGAGAGGAGDGPASGGQPTVPATGGPADVVALVALVRGRLGSDVDAADDLRAVVATHRALRAQALVLAGRLAEVDAALAAGGPARRCCPRG